MEAVGFSLLVATLAKQPGLVLMLGLMAAALMLHVVIVGGYSAFGNRIKEDGREAAKTASSRLCFKNGRDSGELGLGLVAGVQFRAQVVG